MFRVLKDIFSHKKYVSIAAAAAFVSFWMLVLASNIPLIVRVLGYGTAGMGEKVKIITSLFLSVGTNFSFFSLSMIIIISFLTGLNLSTILYAIRHTGAQTRGVKITAAGGLGGAFLGGGCASCGTLVITPFLFSLGLGWVIPLLPLRGQEFNIFAALVLTVSLVVLLRRLSLLPQK